MMAPGSLTAIEEGLSQCLLIERVPHAGHSDGIRGGEGVCAYYQGACHRVGPART